MPSLDSSRSTCLVACLVARPRAAARPSPMAETASEALCSTPIVALHRLSTRLACRSCSNTLPSTRCTASNENRLMSATWGLMTCSARFVGCLRGRLVKTRWGESGLAKLQCYCVMAASPILLGNAGGAGDSIIPTLAREQNEGIHKRPGPIRHRRDEHFAVVRPRRDDAPAGILAGQAGLQMRGAEGGGVG